MADLGAVCLVLCSVASAQEEPALAIPQIAATWQTLSLLQTQQWRGKACPGVYSKAVLCFLRRVSVSRSSYPQQARLRKDSVLIMRHLTKLYQVYAWKTSGFETLTVLACPVRQLFWKLLTSFFEVLCKIWVGLCKDIGLWNDKDLRILSHPDICFYCRFHF